MDTREVLYQVADRVATVTLNRPDQLNAFTRRMRDELINCFERADADDGVHAVVVAGASPDALEGIASFREMRAPHFTMRPSTDMPSFYPWWDERPFK